MVAAVARLEGIVHPLVREAEDEFRKKAAAAGLRMVLLDIPLLFETSAADRVDVVILASTSPGIQRARAFKRPGMTEERFAAILARQMADDEKRRRAHFIVDTSGDFAETRRQVADVMRAVAGIGGGR